VHHFVFLFRCSCALFENEWEFVTDPNTRAFNLLYLCWRSCDVCSYTVTESLSQQQSAAHNQGVLYRRGHRTFPFRLALVGHEHQSVCHP
jgi:hypothetical protein